MIALLALASLSFPIMRVYARRVDRSDGDPVGKLHRLRRANLVWALLLVPVVAVAVLERSLDSALLGDLSPVVTLAAFPLAIIASLVGAYVGIRPVYERLRGIEGTTQGAPRRVTRLLLVLLAPQVVWLGGFYLLLRLDAHPVLVMVAVLAFVVSVAACGPLLVRAAMPTRAPDPGDEKQLTELCARHGVAIRGIRVIDTRHDPAANALFSGFGPGPKYVFVTDRLLEAFETDELAAVLAHEIAHRKQHHIGIKLAATLVSAAVVASVLTAVVFVAQIRSLPPSR